MNDYTWRQIVVPWYSITPTGILTFSGITSPGYSGLFGYPQDPGSWWYRRNVPSDQQLIGGYTVSKPAKGTWTAKIVDGATEGEEYEIAIGGYAGTLIRSLTDMHAKLMVHFGDYEETPMVAKTWIFTPTNDGLVDIEADGPLEAVVTVPPGYVDIYLTVDFQSTQNLTSQFCFTFWDMTLKSKDRQAEWEDEQRGFWDKVLAWFQKIWDAIMSIPEAIAQLPQKILDGIKSLFIPEEGELQELIDDFKLYAEGKLGFVAQLVGLVPAVIGPMLEAGSGDVVIVLPRVYLTPAYGGIELWDEQGLNLTQVINGNNWLSLFYGMYKVLASVLLLGLILRYLYRVMHDILDQREEE